MSEQTKDRIYKFVGWGVALLLWGGLGWWLVQLAILPDIPENDARKALGQYLLVCYLVATVLLLKQGLDESDKDRPDGNGK